MIPLRSIPTLAIAIAALAFMAWAQTTNARQGDALAGVRSAHHPAAMAVAFADQR